MLNKLVYKFFYSANKASRYMTWNKKNHWLQVSASKLLGYELGNIKMPSIFFGQNLRKNFETEKLNMTIEFYML